MEHRTLGKTGLEVTVVGMGTWRTFDVLGRVAQNNARAVVDASLAAGANFFDTSSMYSEAERVLSEALRGRRARAIIATKIWASSAREGQSQAERARKFFCNYIDLYQIHNRGRGQNHPKLLNRL